MLPVQETKAMGLFKEVREAGRRVAGAVRIPASIGFRNESDTPIRVVMDSNREIHTIAARGTATFGRANVGDAPTFRVYHVGGEECLFSRRVHPVGVKASYGWNEKGAF